MNHRKKIFFVLTLFTLSFSLIVYIFWWQDHQYSLATPKPLNYKEIPFGYKPAIKLPTQPGKPVLMHFFNAGCPCSKFNTQHFSYLVKTYGHQLDFVVVFQNEEEDVDSTYFEELTGNIRYIIDPKGVYADSLGVYATPQAVLLDKQGNIFYRGNYNKTRYCANENTQYARIAIDKLLYNQKGDFANPAAAFTAYGCQLPSDKY